MREYLLRTPVPVAQLNPFGELPPAAYLRLLQLAAARASDAAGLDTDWYASHGTTWIVRFTRLQLLEPAAHDDDLVIRTWVSDIRRVRSWRQYQVSRAADGAALANASTDWVYVNARSGAPAAVPAAVQQAIMPDGIAIEERPRRTRFASGVDPSPFALRRVELADLDSLGHVNNSTYASFVEHSLLAALEKSGWYPDFTAGAAHLRPSSLEIEYLSPALYGDYLSARVAFTGTLDNEASATIEVLANERTSALATGSWQWSEGRMPEALRVAIER